MRRSSRGCVGARTTGTSAIACASPERSRARTWKPPYAEADVLLLASRAETYGMVVTEALARGLPVIATDVGGVREALGHAADGSRPGVLVPPGDSQALARALRDWLTDSGLRRRLRAAARSRRKALSTGRRHRASSQSR